MVRRTAFVAYPSEPSFIGVTVEAAVRELARQEGEVRFLTWRASDIAGQFLSEAILDDVANREALVADISRLNFNVTYEIGFAIGRRKRLILIRNSAISVDRDAAEVGIFDTLGHSSYQNSKELTELLKLVDAGAPLSLETGRLNVRSPVYLLEAKFKTDQITRVISRVKKARLFFRSFDPNEEPRLSPSIAVRNVAESYGVLVPLLPSTSPDARVHNVRAAFIAGLAGGMGKVLTILQFGQDPVPLDYRDFATPCFHPSQIDESIEDFAERVAEAFQTKEAVVRDSPSFLASVNLGASAAENEFQELGNYYLETNAFRGAYRGEFRTILGRKGSGKTAIFFQVRNRIRRDPANVVLDLKPEGYQLRKFRESVLRLLSQGTFEHTITAFWEYLLLLEICHKILDNDKMKYMRDRRLYEAYRALADTYDSDQYVREGDFAERMSKLIQAIADNYTERYAGRLDVALSAQELTNLLYMHDVDRLKRELGEYLRSFKKAVWLLFDNIDKGWSPHGITPDDLTIVRCLLDATRKLERDLSSRPIDAHSLIFLRVDVYEHLLRETSDRGKESKVVLDWNDGELLREMMRKRFVFNEPSPGLDFQEVWSRICVRYVDGEESFQYLIDRSLMRPRYLINLVSYCKSHAVNLRHSRIEVDDVERGLQSYSSDLVAEIGLEIRDVLPEAEDVLYCLVGVTRVIAGQELEKCLQAGGFGDRGLMARIIDILLWYGVLGIWISDEESTYIYDVNYDANLLRAMDRKRTARVYSMNPAMWKGLGIK